MDNYRINGRCVSKTSLCDLYADVSLNYGHSIDTLYKEGCINLDSYKYLITKFKIVINPEIKLLMVMEQSNER